MELLAPLNTHDDLSFYGLTNYLFNTKIISCSYNEPYLINFANFNGEKYGR